MKADQIERWVGQISKGFGNEYMFTARSSRDGTNYGHYQVIQHLKVSTNIGHTEHDKFYCSRKRFFK